MGRAEGLAQLWKAVQQCLEYCGRPLQDVAAVCVGLAGLDHQPEVAAELAEALRTKLAPGTEISVYDEAVITLCSGTAGHPHGCVVIAGEGIASPIGAPGAAAPPGGRAARRSRSCRSCSDPAAAAAAALRRWQYTCWQLTGWFAWAA